MRTRNMEEGIISGLIITANNVVEDFLDSGAKSDTGEGESAKGFRPLSGESTTLSNEQPIWSSFSPLPSTTYSGREGILPLCLQPGLRVDCDRIPLGNLPG